jgi:hypothetical protein
VALAALALVAAACGDTDDTARSASDAQQASVAFASPSDGASVANPVHVTFAASHFTVEPAGEVHEHAGHLHVMVDVPCVEPGQSIPKDAQHLHFGGGQTEATIDLAAGRHTLCLQAGDGTHTALDLTDEITVTVDDTPSVAFLSPAKGASVASPVVLQLAAYNLTVEPAGEVHEHAGHLHVMVDVPCVEPGQAIPKDDHHAHLGQGQTELSLDLAPGAHTLCLQAGDGAHTALPITRIIDVTVTAPVTTTAAPPTAG